MDRKKRLRQQRRPPAQRVRPATDLNIWQQEFIDRLQRAFDPLLVSPQVMLKLTKLDGRGEPIGKPIITSAKSITIDGKPMFEMTKKGNA